MKQTTNQLIVALTAGLLLGLSADAIAQRPGGRPNFPPGGPRHVGGGGAIGDAAELAAHRDAFESYRCTNLLGSAYYSKANVQLQSEHARIYELICSATTGDRLNEPDARVFVDRLVAIGTAAKILLGTADELSEANAESTMEKLDALRADVTKAIANKVEANEVSVNINRSQWLMDELHRYAVAKSALSTGQASSLRRKLESLESEEDSAKKDNSLSEREREKLLEECRETWIWCAKAFS